jgi:hypothetical protein
MSEQLPLPPPLPPAAVQLIEQASRALGEAAGSTDARERYATAHLGALRGAAAVLAARTRPESGRRRPRSAWVLLEQVAPELGEWAAFFDTTQARRDAVRGGAWVSAREADDLLRDAQAFLGLIERVLAPALRDRRPAPPG